MTEQERGKVLLTIARGAIAEALGGPHLTPPQEDWLKEWGATFVTLTQDGQLRGCIGTLEAHRPLGEDVYKNARAAAFHDPRFMPLSREELDLTTVEVSLLSPPQAMTVQGEVDALAQLRPGVDGVIFEFGLHRSTFLPQVWDQLPQPRQFMAHLKRKAGLPEEFWSDEIRLSRYTVHKWKESTPGRA